MQIQVIKNRFDNQLKEYSVDLSKLVESPLEMSKDNAPLYQTISLLSASEPKRDQKNYDKSFALILDFDGAVSISEFEQKYKQYQFYLYTTASHTNYNNRFRAILPLKFSVSYKVFSDKVMIECLEVFFPGIDKSSFKNFHIFPIIPTDKTQEYYYKINTGELWSFELLEKNYKRLERKKKSMEMLKKMNREDNKTRKNSNMNEQQKINYKNAVIENIKKELKLIPQFQNGSRYNSLVSVTGKMCSAKYPSGEYIFELWDIKDWILGHTRGKNVENMVENIFRKRG